VVAATTFLSAGTADAGSSPVMDAGPPYDFTTELMGQFVFVPLMDKAILTRTTHGYVFRTGQQDSRLVIKQVDRGLRFHDRGTKYLIELSPSCRQRPVKVGIAAVCRIPGDISRRQPLLVEVWPRLGDDYTDAHTLSAKFAVTVLGDEGNDTAWLGAGPDFFNGHSGRDRVRGGAGADWVRAGLGNDVVRGGPGADHLVGMQGNDVLYGGRGDDRVDGNEHDDHLYGGAGADFLVCGDGVDSTDADGADRRRFCERFLGR
jgi:hypothetical protein